MPGYCQLLLTLYLAFIVQSRFVFFRDFHGLPRALFALGLTFFAVTWVNFLLYVVLGWGWAYDLATWVALIFPILAFWYCPGPDNTAARHGCLPTKEHLTSLFAIKRWDFAFLFFALLVTSRFYVGIYTDPDGTTWSNFNLVDTAFHLSIANSFLAAPRFPPVDLNVAGLPLKYHFLGDFPLAHFTRFGLTALHTTWLLNVLSASALVGALWATFTHWLKLPPRWVLLAATLFLFLNLAVINLLHFSFLEPDFFKTGQPIDGILFFPYFNFESILNNLLEPQRGFLFSLPAILAVLHIAFGTRAPADSSPPAHTLAAFAIICLLPLAHIVGFLFLAPCLLPRLYQHRLWLLHKIPVLAAFFALGLAQLAYIQFYGPPLQPGYAAWDATQHLPLHAFTVVPEFLRRPLFWLLINGDFLFWGTLFALLALVPRYLLHIRQPAAAPLLEFLGQWKVYLLLCIACFLLVNYYRYTLNWGDSNKFVFFLNLGLSLIIAHGAAQWRLGPDALRSRLLWLGFFLLAFLPPAYDFYVKSIVQGNRSNLLFHSRAHSASTWIQQNLPPEARILTAAGSDAHFITSLAARPTLAGIYTYTNPYLDSALPPLIRKFYEECDLSLLSELKTDYVCLSTPERNLYKLSPRWKTLTENPALLAYSIQADDDYHSVYLFNAAALRALPPIEPAPHD